MKTMATLTDVKSVANTKRVKSASHCPIITEYEGTQSVVQSGENCSGPIVSIPLLD